ncbi:hypothetical protein K402DRAFT_154327 [Aulographum hederae CBS 113979]|uniref:Uncharacterized protein n=1 Tax=Aulographum hederae CBS 113979 TaxID=1176131 RepID=A0A6G1GSS4_9PEZI|nr:hypothetical protein K402DRAFT_154327 [Aulographum hederae CBS 113979]
MNKELRMHREIVLYHIRNDFPLDNLKTLTMKAKFPLQLTHRTKTNGLSCVLYISIPFHSDPILSDPVHSHRMSPPSSSPTVTVLLTHQTTTIITILQRQPTDPGRDPKTDNKDARISEKKVEKKKRNGQKVEGKRRNRTTSRVLYMYKN